MAAMTQLPHDAHCSGIRTVHGKSSASTTTERASRRQFSCHSTLAGRVGSTDKPVDPKDAYERAS